MKKALAIILAASAVGNLYAYNPDSEYVHRVGNYIYELNHVGSTLSGEATMVDVKEGYVPTGEITIPGSITIDGVRYEVAVIGDIYQNERFFEREQVFKNFTGITRVNIPSTIRVIGKMEFIGCTGINEFHVNANNKYYKDVDGVLMHRNEEDSKWWRLCRMPPARPKTKYTIPEEVYFIEDCAFADQKTLKQLILNETCTFSSLWAWGNRSINQIDVAENQWYEEHDGILFRTYWEMTALSVCPPALNVGTYTVPRGCTDIGDGAFCYSAITGIVLPDNVELGAASFAGSKLEALECTVKNLGVTSVPNLCTKCPNLRSLHIKGGADEVVKIGRFAFAGCPELNDIVIDPGNVELYMGAFYHCTGLKSFPMEKVTVMDDGTPGQSWYGEQFTGSGLTSVSWPSRVTKVPESCFQDCTKLQKVDLDPEGTGELQQIGITAFKGCTALKELNLAGVNVVSGGAFTGAPMEKLIVPERDAEQNTLDISSAFTFSADTRVYIATPAVEWSTVTGSENDETATFIVSPFELTKYTVPNSWTRLYCAAGKKDWFETNYAWYRKGQVTELFTFYRSETEPNVEVNHNPASADVEFVVTQVLIDGEPATSVSDGVWVGSGSQGALHSEVRVEYLADGVAMSTTYPKDVVVSAVEAVGLETETGVPEAYDLRGLKGTSGILIVKYPDGRVEKILK